jgi:hypothetical protein
MTLLVGFLRSLFIHREALILENLALRQQLATYKRNAKRPHLRVIDRAFWIGFSKLWWQWSTAPGAFSMLRSSRAHRVYALFLAL